MSKEAKVSKEEKEPRIPRDVMIKLLGITVAMLTLPLIAFFVFRYLGYSAVWSGGSAAVVVHILLAYFLFIAFTEKTPDYLNKKKNE